MKKLFLIAAFTLGLGVSTLSAAVLPEPDRSGNAFADDDLKDEAAARALVDEVIANHGGMDLWTASSAVRFTHISHMPQMSSQLDWMVGHEHVEHSTLRAYADHPLWDSRIAKDENGAWGVNWLFPNSPKGMSTIHYFMAFMPWLSQDEDVRFGELGEDMLPGDMQTNYITVPFWYTDEGGDKVGNTWILYVDPDTRMLGGFSIDFGSAQAFHRIEGLSETSGLVLPADWITYAGPQLQIIGYHSMVDVDLNLEFDERRLVMPAGADTY